MMTTEDKLQKHFDEWLTYAPEISTARNGDGEYENPIAFELFKLAEFIYKKGVWDGAYQAQLNAIEGHHRHENEVVRLMHSAYWSEKGSDTQRMVRVFRELVNAGLLKGGHP